MTSQANNCWEALKCKEELRDHCLAYKFNAGKECFYYRYGRPKERIMANDCESCSWYKMNY